MQDVFIFAGMFISVCAGIFGAIVARLIFIKVGAILSAGVLCLGFSYFGWKPFLGGPQSMDRFFGAAMLVIGLCVAVILADIEEAFRKVTSPADARRGFAVITSDSRPSE